MRWINWLIALLGGYFWLPCPLCGKKFGGHENSGTLMTSYSRGVCVCKKCKAEADRQNTEFWKEGHIIKISD